MTEGQLTKRFSDTRPTGRDAIALADLSLFLENPILGVGPGMGMTLRASYYARIEAHTEFTRMLAEHGALGLLALLVLLSMIVRALAAPRPIGQRRTVVACFAWAITFMLANAMRLVAPSLMIGLALAKLGPDALPRRRG